MDASAIFFRLLHQLLPKPKPWSPVTLREKILGAISGDMLAYLGKMSLGRRDEHETDHLMAALYYGNSAHDHWPCFLPDGFRETFLEHGRRLTER